MAADVEQGRKLRADADLALQAIRSGTARLAAQRERLAKFAATRRLASQQYTRGAINEQDRAIALGEKARDIVELMADVSAAAAMRTTLEALPGPILRPKRPDEASQNDVELPVLPVARFAYRLPVAGAVVTGLGEVSETGVRARGLTIAARPDALVVAPADGRIAFAGPFRGFGSIVIIDHGRGLTTLITSLAALDARVGDNVLQGSPVGRAGHNQPTITIELRRGNQPIDITPLLG